MPRVQRVRREAPRRFLFGPNRSGFNLEMHETILGPGTATHAPHKHEHEEAMILLEGTLDAYLEAGLAKTAAARALGIRRQTLYARLERISRLLGGLDIEARQARTALDLALVSWRMRASAVTGR